MLWRLTAVLATTLACVLGWVVAAQATFPGANGKIAFFFSDQDIYVANPDGSGLTNVTNSRGSASNIEPSWSADGTRFAYTTSGNPSDPASRIYFINPDGSGRTQVTSNPNSQTASQPSWSPDGIHIAYTFSHCNGCASSVNVTTIPGAQLTENRILCCDAGYASDPVWSPDGTKIAFLRSSFPDTAPWSLWTMNADGSNPAPVCCDSTMSVLSPDWSPDGKTILFQNGRGDFAFYRVNVDGTGLTHVYSPPAGGSMSGGAWSPDGTRIVFAERGNSSLGNAIFTMKLDGSDRVRVTQQVGSFAGYAFPSWQPIPGPRRSDYANAAQFCKAERDFFGADVFAEKYGTNGNGADGHGKCVSRNH